MHSLHYWSKVDGTVHFAGDSASEQQASDAPFLWALVRNVATNTSSDKWACMQELLVRVHTPWL